MDVIHAVQSESGNLKFLSVRERGGYVQRIIYLPRFPSESTILQDIHALVAAHGGISGVDMGGIFTYAVPETRHEVFTKTLANLLQ
jgi:hypothetical protein